MWTKQILNRLADRLGDAARSHPRLILPQVPLSAAALIALSLNSSMKRPVLWITDGLQTLEAAHRDLLALAPDEAANILYFPPWETFPSFFDLEEAKLQSGGGKSVTEPRIRSDPAISGNRFSALLCLLERKQPVIATSIQAMMQRTVPPALLRKLTIQLAVGDEMEIDALSRILTDAGYEFCPEVQDKGQATIRGGLVDVWPPGEALPVRVEFFGPQVESIRLFNPAQQISLEQVKYTSLPPADEWQHLVAGSGKIPATILDYFEEDPVFVWSDEEQVIEHAEMYQVTIDEADAASLTVDPGTLRARIGEMKNLLQVSTGNLLEPEMRQSVAGAAATPGELTRAATVPPDRVDLDIQPIETIFHLPRTALEPDILAETRKKFLEALGQRAAAGRSVAILLDTPGALDHFRPDVPPGVELQLGALSGGFTSESLGFTLVAEANLYGRRKLHGRRYNPQAGRKAAAEAGPRVSEASDIEPGELVVHVEHGIGRYLGLFEIMFNGRLQEVLTIEYADNARLHVPVSQAHLLSRYIGIAGHKVELHKLGGRRWTNDRIAAEHAIQDLAASMLETQAQRNLLDGHSFPPDNPWQKEMEAAFPFAETVDQQRTIEAVKRDMESKRPMDRLVCGDAGYGKTEVAIRAAFKAVMDGRQVAVLVPTTILAQQHHETFGERMLPYPVRVEMLSRFCSGSTHDRVVQGLADGSVDIVIGTHALIQPEIRFKDLGLVVIDEEQRFGVAHKERLKQLRKLVDVLTMTATPIPRTLYMAMTGARDMSIIQTPPRERMAVETIVAPSSDKLVREAILRELSREGQVFYLHNRVMTIDVVEKRLRQLVPEAKIGVGHGQMASGELSEVMEAFIAGDIDVLLCTTIIESGVDIPSANTILVDRADRFGIADLYQLRGRVGRSNCKGYAYFLLPPGERIEIDARKRLETLKRYAHLGAGFNLALRDLEIRGSGNLLGTAQSGHITAIGFDLYCQLLRRSIAKMKGESLPPVIDVEVKLDFISLFSASESALAPAVIPYDYIEDERLRINVYRKMSEACRPEDVAVLQAEIRDRFGPIPPPVARLLKIVEIRVAAAAAGIKEVEAKEDKLLLMRRGDYLMKGKHLPRLTTRTPEHKLDEIISLVKTSTQWGR